MIRDPSDGSVRDKPDVDLAQSLSTRTENASPDKELVSTSTSGLPPITKKADQLARLEKAREWLKNYLHRKPEGNHEPD